MPKRTDTTPIAVDGLTKKYGSVTAVDQLSFTVRPGRITGFLGPNGAGKTTTLRMTLGLVTPSAGRATIHGHIYRQLANPTSVVGAVLDDVGAHDSRSGRHHLRQLCAAARIPASRVDDVLAEVDLTQAADRDYGTYSRGMRQRLSLAQALLGDPEVLIMDEPTNGLDPSGIRWILDALREFADQGRTVLISTHVIAEIQSLLEDVIIINRGTLVAQGTVAQVCGSESGTGQVSAHASDPAGLLAAARAKGLSATMSGGAVLFSDGGIEQVSALAAQERITLREVSSLQHSLEAAFLNLTRQEGK
ncbi:ABC transporter ATP-binding protein [Natronoglycomyces albus]|uniref:ATP-binding cassette domain-containing protein n=1 Tax=Natronoglycomyces albus TaxID=2811108 RepID=A0A895XIT5_9ACTN|nr:ATP-binding cassette domain-containing protein [Natronoglycomyces albus]QSB05254.1 ATP-binding cassette domain-containing protein [Natronoglycomyces albus]